MITIMIKNDNEPVSPQKGHSCAIDQSQYLLIM